MIFDENNTTRQELFTQVHKALAPFYEETRSLKVGNEWDTNLVRNYVQKFSFDQTHPAKEVVEDVIKGLTQYAVHTPHPRYFGLFNPRSGFMAALADYITAIYNPQLAAWSHAPYANEVERYVVHQFAQKFSYPPEDIDGTFCTGGAESNLTAFLCALNHHFPGFKEKGLLELDKRPRIYCSSESHHSVMRAAMNVGLGKHSVVEIAVNDRLEMDTDLLEQAIQQDLLSGQQPIMIVGTAGTTGCGAIDDLVRCGELCQRYKLWFHVDAAFGGAAVIVEKARHWLIGIEKSDSITLDLHKWFSLPMGASLFLTKHPRILHQTFGLYTEYMPKDGDLSQVVNPFAHSIQWSRRFIGLKMYLPLAIYGWKGFEEAIWHHIEMGETLKEMLIDEGWVIQNRTNLPIVCFTHPSLQEPAIPSLISRLTKMGHVWISAYPIHGQQTLRACITNYATQKEDVEELVACLNRILEQKNVPAN